MAANVLWTSVVLFGVYSVALWVLIAYLTADVTSDGRIEGQVVWYCITWVPFSVTAVLISFRFNRYASPLLMSSTFGTIVLILHFTEDFDNKAFYGIYCIGLATLVATLSSLVKCWCKKRGKSNDSLSTLLQR